MKIMFTVPEQTDWEAGYHQCMLDHKFPSDLLKATREFMKDVKVILSYHQRDCKIPPWALDCLLKGHEEIQGKLNEFN